MTERLYYYTETRKALVYVDDGGEGPGFDFHPDNYPRMAFDPPRSVETRLIRTRLELTSALNDAGWTRDDVVYHAGRGDLDVEAAFQKSRENAIANARAARGIKVGDAVTSVDHGQGYVTSVCGNIADVMYADAQGNVRLVAEVTNALKVIGDGYRVTNRKVWHKTAGLHGRTVKCSKVEGLVCVEFPTGTPQVGWYGFDELELLDDEHVIDWDKEAECG